MGIGGFLSFLGLGIQLLITGSDAADGAGFSSPRRVLKKQIPIILSGDWWHHATNLFGSVTEARIAARFKKQSTLGR
jgi:hypothetical protein